MAMLAQPCPDFPNRSYQAVSIAEKDSMEQPDLNTPRRMADDDRPFIPESGYFILLLLAVIATGLLTIIVSVIRRDATCYCIAEFQAPPQRSTLTIVNLPASGNATSQKWIVVAALAGVVWLKVKKSFSIRHLLILVLLVGLAGLMGLNSHRFFLTQETVVTEIASRNGMSNIAPGDRRVIIRE